jgi:hypothetical protein
VKDWRAGDLLCVSAGLAVLLSAALPWVQVEDPPAVLGALVLRMYEPLALLILVGMGLVAVGAVRTVWSALVAIASTLGIAIALLMIAEGAQGALDAYAPGFTAHANGFGVSVLVAAGLLAGVGGVVTAIQREPKVSGHAVHEAPLTAGPSSD